MSKGWVHVICGPMYSGKTEALLRAVRRLDIAGNKLVLFKPTTDTRTETVTSRNGLTFPSTTIRNPSTILFDVADQKLNVVAIDEAQFFDRTLATVARSLALQGVLVLISGLDRDFLGRAFGPMGDILVEADEVTKLTAICFVCKGEATLTQRLVNGRPATKDDPLIVVGGMEDDVYEARCRNDWRLG